MHRLHLAEILNFRPSHHCKTFSHQFRVTINHPSFLEFFADAGRLQSRHRHFDGEPPRPLFSFCSNSASFFFKVFRNPLIRSFVMVARPIGRLFFRCPWGLQFIAAA
jgi:hypothetical protein